jgi:hypothetical protein
MITHLYQPIPGTLQNRNCYLKDEHSTVKNASAAIKPNNTQIGREPQEIHIWEKPQQGRRVEPYIKLHGSELTYMHSNLSNRLRKAHMHYFVTCSYSYNNLDDAKRVEVDKENATTSELHDFQKKIGKPALKTGDKLLTRRLALTNRFTRTICRAILFYLAWIACMSWHRALLTVEISAHPKLTIDEGLKNIGTSKQYHACENKHWLATYTMKIGHRRGHIHQKYNLCGLIYQKPNLMADSAALLVTNTDNYYDNLYANDKDNPLYRGYTLRPPGGAPTYFRVAPHQFASNKSPIFLISNPYRTRGIDRVHLEYGSTTTLHARLRHLQEQLLAAGPGQPQDHPLGDGQLLECRSDKMFQFKTHYLFTMYWMDKTTDCVTYDLADRPLVPNYTTVSHKLPILSLPVSTKLINKSVVSYLQIYDCEKRSISRFNLSLINDETIVKFSNIFSILCCNCACLKIKLLVDTFYTSLMPKVCINTLVWYYSASEILTCSAQRKLSNIPKTYYRHGNAYIFIKYAGPMYLSKHNIASELLLYKLTMFRSLTYIATYSDIQLDHFVELEICMTDQSILNYTLQLCLGANTTSTICYNLKLTTQKPRVLVTIIQLEIFLDYKSSTAIQKICLGANATSTIYYCFLKLRAQNPRVLGVITKFEIFTVSKSFTMLTKQEFYQGINAMSTTYNSYLHSNKNE